MAWTTEMWTKDAVFEVLIRKETGFSLLNAMRAVMGREPEELDLKSFDAKIGMMYRGWVKMNENTRNLGAKGEATS